MTEHLPECLMYDVKVCMCICLELRACEERMLTTYLARDNFEAGLDAAREAIAACTPERPSMRGMLISVNDALAAIDALRKEQK